MSAQGEEDELAAAQLRAIRLIEQQERDEAAARVDAEAAAAASARASTSHLTMITHDIMLGGLNSASDAAALQAVGVTHIVNCSEDIPNHFPQQFTYLRVPVSEQTTLLKDHFRAVNAFVQQATQAEHGGVVLFHCLFGISRSPAFLLAYLVQHRDFALWIAFTFVREARPAINPPTSYWQQLIELEIATRGLATCRLRRSIVRAREVFEIEPIEEASAPKRARVHASRSSGSSSCSRSRSRSREGRGKDKKHKSKKHKDKKHKAKGSLRLKAAPPVKTSAGGVSDLARFEPKKREQVDKYCW